MSHRFLKMRRKRERTPKQKAQDDKYWACGRKVSYTTRAEASQVAKALGHTVYACSYEDHFHTAHVMGSQRFKRREVIA